MDSVEVKFVNKVEIQKSLDKLIEQLIQVHKDIERIILFGSFSNEQYGPASDVDLLIILRDSKLNFLNRIEKYLPSNFPVDIEIFPYTKLEINKMLSDDNYFIKNILENGRQIYPKRI